VLEHKLTAGECNYAADDQAALLQLLSQAEKDQCMTDDQVNELDKDRLVVLENRLRSGPLASSHLAVLQLLGRAEGAHVDSSSPQKTDLRRADSLRAVVQLKRILAEVMSMSSQEETSESDNDDSLGNQVETEEGEVKVKYSGFRPDDLHLLAKAEINPDDLADPIQRIKIENMIKNKGVLTADDQKEQGTSINIIQEGQNSTGKLKESETVEQPLSVNSLATIASGHNNTLAHTTIINMNPAEPLQEKHRMDIEDSKRLEGGGFVLDDIQGQEVVSTMTRNLSRSQSKRLEMHRLELRIKTERIRRSIPDWVLNSLAPPPKRALSIKKSIKLQPPSKHAPLVTAAEEPLPTDLDQVSVTVDSGPEVQAEITAADIVFMESQGAEGDAAPLHPNTAHSEPPLRTTSLRLRGGDVLTASLLRQSSRPETAKNCASTAEKEEFCISAGVSWLLHSIAALARRIARSCCSACMYMSRTPGAPHN